MSGQESEHTPCLSPHSSPGNGTQESFNLSAETFTSEAKNCSPCSFSVLTKTLHSFLKCFKLMGVKS